MKMFVPVLAFILSLAFSIINVFAYGIDEDIKLTKEEYIEASKLVTSPPLKYNKSLAKKKIYDFEKYSITSGEYNVSGYVVGKSECLSPCDAQSMCIELCVKGVIISNTNTKRKLSHTGHDIDKEQDMIIFFYSRGRDISTDLEKLKIGKKYDFSISKNAYQAEIIGFR